MESNSENCFIKNSHLSTVIDVDFVGAANSTNEMVFVIVSIDYLIDFHPDMKTIKGTACCIVNCELNNFHIVYFVINPLARANMIKLYAVRQTAAYSYQKSVSLREILLTIHWFVMKGSNSKNKFFRNWFQMIPLATAWCFIFQIITQKAFEKICFVLNPFINGHCTAQFCISNMWPTKIIYGNQNADD